MKAMFNPSLMCMDFLDIRNQAEVLNERCDFYHVDIMDGHYVKNITLSPDFVERFSSVAKKPMDCHLMVTNPDDYVIPLAQAGAEYISPHAEVINAYAFRILNSIKDNGCKAGVVLNPATPISVIQHYIHRLDMITIMSVDPGFAGQPFIAEVVDKIKELKRLKEENGYEYLIQVDGSCNEKTFKILREAGTEVFVVGTSGLFGKDSSLEKSWDIMLRNFSEQTGE